MRYITTAEAARKWGISSNRVFILARNGRIPGTVQIGSRWMIPDNAEKPADRRTRDCGSIPQAFADDGYYFRYSIIDHKDLDSFNPPLSEDELKIANASDAFFACRFEEAAGFVSDIPEKSDNRYLRIAALYAGCMADISLGNARRFIYHYGKLCAEFTEDFPQKREMSELLHGIDAILGKEGYYSSEFSIDPAYPYNKSFLPLLCTCSAISLLNAESRHSAAEMKMHELNCILLEELNSPANLQSVHVYLGMAYGFKNMKKEMTEHFRRALELAENYELYYIPASQYKFVKDQMKPVLMEFSSELQVRIEDSADDIKRNAAILLNKLSGDNIYNLISGKDYSYIFYALQGYTNKDVAEALHISVSSVAKHYSALYETLGIGTKKELAELYRNTMTSPLF